jgi:hypothetical protein
MQILSDEKTYEVRNSSRVGLVVVEKVSQEDLVLGIRKGKIKVSEETEIIREADGTSRPIRHTVFEKR